MTTITGLALWTATRDEEHAGSTGRLRVHVGGDSIDAGSVPDRGRVGSHVVPGAEFMFDPASTSLAVGISNTNAWGPREAVLLGRVKHPAGELGPDAALGIARPVIEDAVSGGAWVSMDEREGVERWPLVRFRPAPAEARLDEFMILLHTDHRDAETHGAIELGVFVDGGGFPVLAYQTTLPRIGKTQPGEGRYVYRFRLPQPGVPLGAIREVRLTNRSDDAWGVLECACLGWHVDEDGLAVGGLLNRRVRVTTVVGQGLHGPLPEGTETPVDWSISDALRLDLGAEPLCI